MSNIIKNIYSTLGDWPSLFIVFNFIFLCLGSTAIAEESEKKVKTVNRDFGFPTHRRDGGSRGGHCVANVSNENLMAIVPEDVVGSNATNSPELFFYVPEVKGQKTLEFLLRNEQDELIYETFFSTRGDGIISVEVPSDIHSSMFENEQNYHWYLSLICDHQERSRDIVVEGWMHQEKIDVATQHKLQEASSVEKAEVYNGQGFWYDALAILADSQDAEIEQPMVREKWSKMLESVGLAELASKPFIETELVDVPATPWQGL